MDATLLTAGTTIERYVVEDVLGRGGMAIVYRVRHRQLGTLHAMKVLTASGVGVRQRLLQEGRVQAALHHPNVVSVSDVVEVDGAPAVVMEFVAGPSLDRLLADHRLTLPQIDVIAQGMIRGVGAAHAFGLVHRDLKPGNVILAITPDGLVPKIADFGLAKVLDEEKTAVQTRSGTTMGTPAYMAPEQIRNAKAVDSRADVFALGCILYEMVAGRRPFHGEDLLEIFQNIANGRFTPVDTVVPDLPSRMAAAITGAIVVDREARVRDCETLLAIWRGDASSTFRQPTGPFDVRALSTRYSLPSQPTAPPSEAGTFSAGSLVPLSSIDPVEAEAVLEALARTAPVDAATVSRTPPPSKRTLPLPDGNVAEVSATAAPEPQTRLWYGAGLVGLAVVGVGGLAVVTSGALASAWFVLGGEPVVSAPPAPPAAAAAPSAPLEAPVETPPPAVAAASHVPPAQPVAPTIAAPTVVAPAVAPAVAAPVVVSVPAPVATAAVTLAGDATSAWLVDAHGERHELPADLVAGDYDVFATFTDLEAEVAGHVNLTGSEARVIRCSRSLRKCK